MTVFRPARRRFALAAAAVFVSAFATASVPAAADADNRASVDQLITFFETVVFGAELDASMANKVVARWNGPLLIEVKGRATQAHADMLEEQLGVVRRLTGLPVAVAKTAGKPANLTYVFVPRVQMAKLKVPGVDPDMIRRLAAPGGCYFLAFKKPASAIIRGVIVVNIDRTGAGIHHCLLEETLQTVGLPNDTSLLRPSLFSDLDQLAAPSRVDEIAVRALYDDRVEPGMTPAELRPVLRRVITELDAALP
jgi:hypothetical protein